MSDPIWDAMGWLADVIKPDAKVHKQIRLHGVIYRLIGTAEDGAIATDEQYEAGEMSYAHLYPNGEVWRFGQRIGTRKDWEILP